MFFSGTRKTGHKLADSSSASAARIYRVKIQFDSNQEYQLDAIQATLDVFDGQPLAQ